VARLELYGTARCPHTQEMRDWLEWQRRDFVEYDVDLDREARLIQIGWQGRTCMIEAD